MEKCVGLSELKNLKLKLYSLTSLVELNSIHSIVSQNTLQRLDIGHSMIRFAFIWYRMVTYIQEWNITEFNIENTLLGYQLFSRVRARQKLLFRRYNGTKLYWG